MSAAALSPLPVLLPICGAISAPLVARIDRRLPLYAGLAALLASFALLLAQAMTVYGDNGSMLTYFFSAQRPVRGRALGIAFVVDPFGLTFALLTAGLGALLLLCVLSELGKLGPRELGGLSCLVQLLLAALIGAALTGDTVNLFVWFEVAALASYGLTGFFLERPIAVEAAFKNLVLTSMAGFLLFAGAAMLYALSGALNLGQLHRVVPEQPSHGVVVAIALLVAGFATKAGLVPFHGWLPDTHTPVPGAVSALFSALMVDLGVIALARLSLQVFPGLHGLSGLLMVLGLASAVVGALLALVQDDLKRLLAWDTVSQTGIFVVGFSTHTPEGVGGAIYHLVNHGVYKALLFLCAGAVVHATGLTRLSDLGGLRRAHPLLCAGFTLGALAIAGVPPLNGYASLGLIHAGVEHQPQVLVIALIAQVLTIAALGRATWLGFLRRRDEPYEHLESLRPGMRVSLVTLGGACIAFGALAELIVPKVIAPSASVLLHPASYARAALSAGGTVPSLSLSFDYGDPTTLIITGCELLAGLALLVLVLRRPHVTRVLGWLRALHTGIANDYAAFAAVGLAVTAYTLLS